MNITILTWGVNRLQIAVWLYVCGELGGYIAKLHEQRVNNGRYDHTTYTTLSANYQNASKKILGPACRPLAQVVAVSRDSVKPLTIFELAYFPLRHGACEHHLNEESTYM